MFLGVAKAQELVTNGQLTGSVEISKAAEMCPEDFSHAAHIVALLFICWSDIQEEGIGLYFHHAIHWEQGIHIANNSDISNELPLSLYLVSSPIYR